MSQQSAQMLCSSSCSTNKYMQYEKLQFSNLSGIMHKVFCIKFDPLLAQHDPVSIVTRVYEGKHSDKVSLRLYHNCARYSGHKGFLEFDPVT